MKLRIFLLALVLLMLPGMATAKSDSALMLAVFGTSTEASMTFDELLPLVRQRFPERDVVVPFTSGVIRNKLNADIADPAKKILSPAEMLEKLKTEGYKDIAVVSTILFAGVEHDKLKNTVEEFSAANSDIRVSYTPPFLGEPANLKPVVEALAKYMLPDGVNVVVTHGSHSGHPVEQAYLALAQLVAETYSNARAGSVEGVPSMEDTLAWVKSRQEGQVRFIVFMFVAGEHAENDIASDEEDSMFSTVRAMGKTPSVSMVDRATDRRMASLGLDPDYRSLLLDYFVKNVAQ